MAERLLATREIAELVGRSLEANLRRWRAGVVDADELRVEFPSGQQELFM